ncbi:3'-5' exonuclease [Allocoprobacillus halotolerans]|uniref:3'-5' exonuclease n=1 Tax=Allocoprobacillus halotolerans TaxID=2944914 RepID=A0ABY5I0Z9_9FIRM|nr:3'-5' exonuclease [Allocoprobacillus halotolerans]UTY39041.1 3'-5' exonuclease [Allocoprobacillus halotolerans]
MVYRKYYQRGRYVKKLIDDYCVLDIETTGLSWQKDKIIEIGILKIRNQKIVERYSQLINPQIHINAFITQLTGIDNQMVQDMPCLSNIQNDVLQFIGQDIIIGHNVTFDLNFIANRFQVNLPNEYMDTMQFARKVYPALPHHRLTDMVELLNLSTNEHRSLADCISTYELYEHLKNQIIEQNISL